MFTYLHQIWHNLFTVDYKTSFASWSSSVDYIFKYKTKGTIANGDLDTVEYLLRKVIDNADRQLWMISNQTGNDADEKAIFSTYEFKNSLDLFFRKDGSVFNLAILKSDYNFCDPLFLFLKEEGFLDKTRIYQLNKNCEPNYPHFLVNDNNGFRFEKHNGNTVIGRKAFGRANSPEEAKKLINYFREETNKTERFRKILSKELENMIR